MQLHNINLYWMFWCNSVFFRTMRPSQDFLVLGLLLPM